MSTMSISTAEVKSSGFLRRMGRAFWTHFVRAIELSGEPYKHGARPM
jgi:hypothetical protein